MPGWFNVRKKIRRTQKSGAVVVDGPANFELPSSYLFWMLKLFETNGTPFTPSKPPFATIW